MLELWDLSTVVKSSISFSHLFASFFNKLPNQTIKQLQSIYRLHSLNLHFKWIWSIYSLSHTHTHMCARLHTIYSCQFNSVQLRGIEQYIDTHTRVMEYVCCEFALDKRNYIQFIVEFSAVFVPISDLMRAIESYLRPYGPTFYFNPHIDTNISDFSLQMNGNRKHTTENIDITFNRMQ